MEVLRSEINRNRSNRSIFLQQSECTEEILERFGMQNSRPVSTLLEASSKSKSELFPGSSEPVAHVPYRQARGIIVYLMIGTRTDLAFPIRMLSQFLEKPLQKHWISIKCIFRYIAGTWDHGIWFQSNNSNTDLDGYSDSDWAGCRENRKSTTGFLFMLEGGGQSAGDRIAKYCRSLNLWSRICCCFSC